MQLCGRQSFANLSSYQCLKSSLRHGNSEAQSQASSPSTGAHGAGWPAGSIPPPPRGLLVDCIRAGPMRKHPGPKDVNCLAVRQRNSACVRDTKRLDLNITEGSRQIRGDARGIVCELCAVCLVHLLREIHPASRERWKLATASYAVQIAPVGTEHGIVVGAVYQSSPALPTAQRVPRQDDSAALHAWDQLPFSLCRCIRAFPSAGQMTSRCCSITLHKAVNRIYVKCKAPTMFAPCTPLLHHEHTRPPAAHRNQLTHEGRRRGFGR
eukprot:6572276-Prymnesium_polylepis.2